MARPCFPAQVKEFPFTQDEIQDIWRLAKARYIDVGKNFEETVKGMASDLGMREGHIVQAFTKPKSLRSVGNEAWKTMQARRDAINSAKAVVENWKDPSLLKKIDALYNVPRSALTLYHGGVFPVTHMGNFMFVPSRWATFFKATTNAWRFMSNKQYEVAIQRHLADPDYIIARRASRSVDPNQATVGILKNMQGWTGRGFNSLKIARLDLFKKEWHKLAPEEQTLENAKPIMNRIDAATGEVNLGTAGKYLAKVLFAPKLLPARFKAAIIDPIRTVQTFADWKNATAGERQAARFVAKTASQTIASWAALLVINEGINQYSKSKDKVNFLNPSKGDWLSFKIGGLTIRPPNPFIEVLRLAGGIVAPFAMSKKELRGETPEAKAGGKIADYLRYKLHPTFRVASEIASGVDLFGRPLPFRGIRQRLTGETTQPTPTKPQIDWPEYVMGKGPIPLGGGAREFYDMLREEGLSHADAMTWMRAGTVAAIEATGVQAHETPPERPTKASQPASHQRSEGRHREKVGTGQ